MAGISFLPRIASRVGFCLLQPLPFGPCLGSHVEGEASPHSTVRRVELLLLVALLHERGCRAAALRRRRGRGLVVRAGPGRLQRRLVQELAAAAQAGAQEGQDEAEGGGRTLTAEKLRCDGGGSKGRAVARTLAKGGSARRVVVVRPVDEDLYQVPPPEFTSQRPRRVRADGGVSTA